MNAKERRKRHLRYALTAHGMCMTCAIGLLALMLKDAHKEQDTNTCIENLRKIELGKEQWAREKGTNNPYPKEEMNTYIEGGAPICPAKGVYHYASLDETSTCSTPHHALP